MRVLRAIGIACVAASPVCGQAIYQPPPVSVDVSNISDTAQQALTAAQNAQASADASVKSVNGNAPNNGAVTLDLSTYARIATLSAYVTSAALAPYSTTAQMNAAITAAQPNLTPYATTTALNSAIAGIVFPVTSVNGSTGAVSVSTYTDAQAVAANASTINAVATSTTQFVAGGAFIPQATMRATYACAAGLLGRYARVNDMYGTVSSVATCETDGTSYYWRPQRTDYATVIAQTTGNVSLVPFVTAPVVYLSQAPTANMTITPSVANVWPGASFHIYAPATITLGTITLNGLVGGGTVSLLQGSDKILTYTSAGWKSN